MKQADELGILPITQILPCVLKWEIVLEVLAQGSRQGVATVSPLSLLLVTM